MKIITGLGVCFMLLFMQGKTLGQQQKRMDTLKVHKNNFELIRHAPDKCFYIRNNRIHIECPEDRAFYISKKVLKKDTSYYLKLYYDKGFNRLYAEGNAYKHCFTGKYTQYYPDGTIHKKGVFQTVKSNSGLKSNCNNKTRDWHYYDSTGKKMRTESWAAGQFTGGRTWDYLRPWDVEVTVNGHPYEGHDIKVENFDSFDIKFYTKDHNKNYGRYEVSILVTGGKTPVTKQRLDYTVLEYFDLQKFLNKYFKPGSDLYITVEDTKTGVYFSTTFELKEQ